MKIELAALFLFALPFALSLPAAEGQRAGDTVMGAERQALRRAIEDLAATFPGKYVRGPEFLQRLEAVKSEADFRTLRKSCKSGDTQLISPLLGFSTALGHVVRKTGGDDAGDPGHENRHTPDALLRQDISCVSPDLV